MNEEFLCYLWSFQQINWPLRTTDGEKITVFKAGYRNTNAGPDFHQALLKIGKSLWAGHVEVHIKTSDWYQHKHHLDKKYSNVILHIVYQDDSEKIANRPLNIPVLKLKDRFKPTLYCNYQHLIKNQLWVSCQNQIKYLDLVKLRSFLTRLSIDRLERKVTKLQELLIINKFDYSQCFYELLFQNFGYNKNAYAFGLLAKSIPFNILQNSNHSCMQLEALLFGQAGFLEMEFKEDYPRKLQSEYLFLKRKFQLRPIELEYWNFLRMRPSNFPTLRIAQLASILFIHKNLASQITETHTLNELIQLFRTSTSEYWDTHFHFNKISKFKSKSLGFESIKLLIINTIIPYLFVYGKNNGSHTYQDRALSLLEALKSEQNYTIRKWNKYGLSASTAMESQALLELKNTYCDKYRCLECQIGIHLIKDL